ncbi:MAG: enoyl-CoA hydratase/isomerase family protein [Deltaproteobacteria bacterium]|nr:enoyl-CoA hydratase/isomerase family protein [Deltaproteobacteria bacterium]
MELDRDFECLIVDEPEAGIVLCTFNRLASRNALNRQMVDELHQLCSLLEIADDVKALVFTGAGQQAFISGADIAELRERRAADALASINSALFGRIERLPMPTIAAIRGFALGGGCEFAIACDLRVCGESARFGQPEVALGIMPAAGGTYRLPRLIGLGRARELIFTCRVIDAVEAQSIGLVERVVPDAEVIDAAYEWARSIAKNGQLAVRLAKAALNNCGHLGLASAIAFESASQAICFEDGDKQARMTAFLQRKSRRS